MIKFFHPSLLSGKPQKFSFSEAHEKIGASKDFRLHPHKNSDIIKTIRVISPICMIFYSTKISGSETIKYSGILPRSNTRNIFILLSSNFLCMLVFPMIKFFHPSLLSGKAQTFSFSEAHEKNRRVKGFSVASSLKF